MECVLAEVAYRTDTGRAFSLSVDVSDDLELSRGMLLHRAVLTPSTSAVRRLCRHCPSLQSINIRILAGAGMALRAAKSPPTAAGRNYFVRTE